MKRIIFIIVAGIGVVSAQTLTPAELIEQMHSMLQPPATTHHRTHRHSVRSRHPVTSSRIPVAHRTHPRQMRRSPLRRRFRSLAEYQRLRQKKVHQATTGRRHASTSKHGRYVGNGWYVDEHGQYDEQYSQPTWHEMTRPRLHHPQRGHRYYRHRWYVDYHDKRRPFVDRHGYYYGYFNQRGFYFDSVFYRYDRAYTYQDRLHGKGLFEHRFYHPIRRRHRVRSERTRWSNISEGFQFQWSWRN